MIIMKKKHKPKKSFNIYDASAPRPKPKKKVWTRKKGASPYDAGAMTWKWEDDK